MANDLEMKVRIGAELGELRRALQQVQGEVRGLGDNLRRNTDGAAGGFGAIQRGAQAAAAAVASYLTVAGAVNITRSIIQTADSYQQLAGRLKLVTSSSEELAQVQRGLFEVSQQTGSELSGTTELYAKLARNTQRLGLSQEQLLQVTKTVNQTIKLSSANAEAAAASMLQFGQALAGPKFQAEELNSIIEQTPELAKAIEQGLGIASGTLKTYAEDVGLTGEQAVQALLKVSGEIDKQFGSLPDSVGSAMTRLKNEVKRAVGQTDLTPLVSALDDLRETVSDPDTIQGLQAIASGLVTIASKATSAASAVGNFSRWVGEELASKINGPALDDIPRLSQRIAQLRTELENMERLGVRPGSLAADRVAKLREELTKYEVAERAAIKAKEDSAVAEGKAAKAAEERTKQMQQQAAEAMKVAQAEADRKRQEEEAEQLSKQRQKQIASTIADMEKQAATFGKNTAETADYELALLGATEAERKRAREIGAQIDSLKAKAEADKENARAVKESAKAAEEAARKEEELRRAKESVRARILSAEGKDPEARAIELRLQYEQLIADLEARGDAAGVSLVNKLINLEVADARIKQLRDKIGSVTSGLERKEDSIGNSVLAGDMSQSMARTELQGARDASIEKLREYRAELEKLNKEDVPGAAEALRTVDEEIANISNRSLTGMGKAIQGLRADLQQLGNDVAGELIGILRDGLANLFMDLATGSKSAKEALGDFVKGFVAGMAQIAARALATYAVLQLLEFMFPGAGKMVAGTFAAAGAVTAGQKHGGGKVGHGTRVQVDPSVFIGAPRYHAGGVAGLKPGEVPAILKEGETVRTREQEAALQSRQHGGGVRVVNVVDPNLVQDYMSSSSGEQVLLNVLQRNSGVIKQVLA